jgi:hypothetical protein
VNSVIFRKNRLIFVTLVLRVVKGEEVVDDANGESVGLDVFEGRNLMTRRRRWWMVRLI